MAKLKYVSPKSKRKFYLLVELRLEKMKTHFGLIFGNANPSVTSKLFLKSTEQTHADIFLFIVSINIQINILQSVDYTFQLQWFFRF